MGLIILFSVILILSVIAVIFTRTNYNWDDWEPAAWFGTLIGGFGALIIIIVLIDQKNTFAYEIEQYQNLREQVETLSNDDIVTGENLRNQVLEMNNKISKHRIYSKSSWVGLYYSEEIGNLEPLKWGHKE